MTRSKPSDDSSARLENARLRQEVSGLKRRIEELEQGGGQPQPLEIHERTIRQIVDLVPHVLFVKDIDGRFLLVNRVTATAFGLTVEQMAGRAIDEIFDNPDLVERYCSDDLEAINTGVAKHIAEEPFIDAQGGERWHQAIKTVPDDEWRQVRDSLRIAGHHRAKKGDRITAAKRTKAVASHLPHAARGDCLGHGLFGEGMELGG